MANQPYELLVRWDHQTGALKGAHVKTYDNATMREGDAQTVAVAGNAGFPLAEILTAVEQGAIAAMDVAVADLATEKAAHAETKAALATAEASLTAAQASIIQMQVKIDELTAATVHTPEVIAAYQASQPVLP